MREKNEFSQVHARFLVGARCSCRATWARAAPKPALHDVLVVACLRNPTSAVAGQPAWHEVCHAVVC